MKMKGVPIFLCSVFLTCLVQSFIPFLRLLLTSLPLLQHLHTSLLTHPLVVSPLALFGLLILITKPCIAISQSQPPFWYHLINLVKLQLIELHSLQVGQDSSQLTPFSEVSGVHDWGKIVEDFSDTAFLIDQLDLVLTVDTAVAHLAGALNKPVWLLLPHNADFRWLHGRSDSPWYPNMRLFRQPKRGDWSGLMAQVQEALNQLFLLDLPSLSDAKL